MERFYISMTESLKIMIENLKTNVGFCIIAQFVLFSPFVLWYIFKTKRTEEDTDALIQKFLLFIFGVPVWAAPIIFKLRMEV